MSGKLKKGTTSRKNEVSQEKKIAAAKYFADGKNCNQIAKILNISSSTVGRVVKSGEYDTEVLRKNRYSRKVNSIKNEIEKGDLSFIQQYNKDKKEIWELAAERIKELIPSCNKLDSLVKLAEICKPILESDQKESPFKLAVIEKLEALTIVSNK